MQFELRRTYVFEPEHRKSSITKDIYICCTCKKEFRYRKGILNHLANCNKRIHILEPCEILADKLDYNEVVELFIEEFRYFGKGHNHKHHKESITKDTYPLLRILKNTMLFLKKKTLHRYIPLKKQQGIFYHYNFEQHDWETITEENWMIELMYFILKIYTRNYENKILLWKDLQKELFPWCKTVVKDSILIEDLDYDGDYRGDYVSNMETFYDFYQTKREQIHTIINYTNMPESVLLKNEYTEDIQKIIEY